MAARVGSMFVVSMGSFEVQVTFKRVKNVNFRIDPNGTARMSVPLHMSKAQAEKIARNHKAWFEESLARAKERRTDVPQMWQTGEKISVWGTQTPLRVVQPGESAVPCELVNGELVLVDAGDAVSRAQLVEKWLGNQLAEQAKELLPDCEKAVGRHASHITIRRMKSRWGSCTPKTARIRLNTALAECPKPCTRTVLVHELCHLIVFGHGPQFRALMDLHCPDWRVWQRWLDEHTPSTLQPGP